MSILEDWFFIPLASKSEYIYACSYVPRSGGRPMGIVIAPPVGRERLRCYRETVSLARDLAAAGFPVIRMDYRGEGESSGRFEDSTIASRLDDVLSAARELTHRAGVERLCILGIRAGALPAVLASARAEVTRLVLWDPVCNPRTYARNLIRSHVMLREHYFGEKKKGGEIEAQLREGEPALIYGFRFGWPLMEELQHLDLTPQLQSFAGPTGIFYFSPRLGPPGKATRSWQELLSREGQATLHPVAETYSWASRKRWWPRIEALNMAIAGWLEGAA